MRSDWSAIRQEYETTPISLRALARQHGAGESQVMARAAAEHWHKTVATQNRSRTVATQNHSKEWARRGVTDIKPRVPRAESEERGCGWTD